MGAQLQLGDPANFLEILEKYLHPQPHLGTSRDISGADPPASINGVTLALRLLLSPSGSPVFSSVFYFLLGPPYLMSFTISRRYPLSLSPRCGLSSGISHTCRVGISGSKEQSARGLLRRRLKWRRKTSGIGWKRTWRKFVGMKVSHPIVAAITHRLSLATRKLLGAGGRIFFGRTGDKMGRSI